VDAKRPVGGIKPSLGNKQKGTKNAGIVKNKLAGKTGKLGIPAGVGQPKLETQPVQNNFVPSGIPPQRMQNFQKIIYDSFGNPMQLSNEFSNPSQESFGRPPPQVYNPGNNYRQNAAPPRPTQPPGGGPPQQRNFQPHHQQGMQYPAEPYDPMYAGAQNQNYGGAMYNPGGNFQNQNYGYQ